MGCGVNREILRKRRWICFAGQDSGQTAKKKICKWFLACNPNNRPVFTDGSGTSSKDCNLCEKRQIYLVVDECFLILFRNPSTYLKGELKGKESVSSESIYQNDMRWQDYDWAMELRPAETLMTNRELNCSRGMYPHRRRKPELRPWGGQLMWRRREH